MAPVACSSEDRERERGKGGVELQDGENAERKQYSVSFQHSRKDAGAGSGKISWKQQWDSPVADEGTVDCDLDLEGTKKGEGQVRSLRSPRSASCALRVRLCRP